MNTVKVLNPLKELHRFGQSVWFDYVRRHLLTSGELQRLIDQDGLRGMTSNPAIFERAIAGSADYDQALAQLVNENLDAKSLYERLAVEDIQKAADIMRAVYVETAGADGFVSLEVSPDLANETTASIEEARRLWKLVDRPNLMVKIPGTQAGLPAIETLISEGININVTLLFSQEAYRQVAEAYLKGLEKLLAKGGDLTKVASVASFFVSRIDTAVDNLLTKQIEASKDAAQKERLRGLLGKVAIANAKQAYQFYKQFYNQPRWLALAKHGARPQRLLWASTGTKNPQYSDVLYVDQLIGPNTVNTIPPATFDAYRQHGKPSATLEADLDQADAVMNELEASNISIDQVCDQLVVEGVKLFADAFEKLLGALETKRKSALDAKSERFSYRLGQGLEDEVKQSLQDWQSQGKVQKLWGGDASLWSNQDESKWLGWLNVTYDQLAHIKHLEDLAQEIKAARFEDAVILGMGGSSLGPEVLAKTFGRIAGFPQMHILDSTDPAQIQALEAKLDLKRTIFVVSSKSGGTLEPNIFEQYFYSRMVEVVSADQVGQHFIAVTDPGSSLERVAKQKRFRHIFYGLASIGGRYSVLSDFGMVPAAIMGVDLAKLLDRTDEMVHACSASVPAEQNPGVLLGTILAIAARHGKDKVTIVASPAVYDLGAWLEQLLAESTGKDGKGLIPIDLEPLGTPAVYGNDRLFCYLRFSQSPDAGQDLAIEKLASAGQPVVRIAIEELYDIGQEFFRWEIATAVAGAIIGLNPFNQPDVEASKIETKRLTAEYEEKGKLPTEKPLVSEDGISLYTDAKNAADLEKILLSSSKDKNYPERSLVDYLRVHFERSKPGDYVAFLAYLEMNDANIAELQALRQSVRDARKVATCLGFGPRFQHSTGQAYKGGPNSGLFMQITHDHAKDLPVPGQKYSFGIVEAAQAQGDFAVLAQRQRRIVRVHLGNNVTAGLSHLTRLVKKALGA